ncbi:MAG: transposase [Ardenticatenia bacterium]|nr:transposase [Ardenticatenia bacterium]
MGPVITEADVDRCFLEILHAYLEHLPDRQAQMVYQKVDILLAPWSQLSSPDQVRLINLLWEHRGSPLETGYRLKEDLKRWLRCQDAGDRAVLYHLVCGMGNRPELEPFGYLLRAMREHGAEYTGTDAPPQATRSLQMVS